LGISVARAQDGIEVERREIETIDVAARAHEAVCIRRGESMVEGVRVRVSYEKDGSICHEGRLRHPFMHE
jgi:hypothetical protein